MKTINLMLVMLVFVVGINAQSRPSDKLFEKMALKKGITMLSFSKEMLDAVNMTFDSDSNDTEHEVTGDLHEVKVVIYNATEGLETMNFREEALGYLPLSKFDEVDPEDQNINNGNGTTDIRVLRSGRKIKECHILFQGDTNGVLLSFFGDFKVDDVKKLANKIDNYK